MLALTTDTSEAGDANRFSSLDEKIAKMRQNKKRKDDYDDDDDIDDCDEEGDEHSEDGASLDTHRMEEGNYVVNYAKSTP